MRYKNKIHTKIVEDYKKGELTIKNIAEKYSVCVATVHNYVKGLGISRNPKEGQGHRLTKQDIEQIVQLYLQGHNNLNISKKVKVTPVTVRRYVHKIKKILLQMDDKLAKKITDIMINK